MVVQVLHKTATSTTYRQWGNSNPPLSGNPPCIFGCFCQIVWPIGLLYVKMSTNGNRVWITGLIIFSYRFLANVLRYVRYMLSGVRLLSVCLLSVTLVHPTQAVELFGNFFRHTIAQGLYFSGAKNRWWGTPLSLWNLRSKWPTPLSNSEISTNIGS